MKKFSCGDVVPGCQAHFEEDDDDAILAQVAKHARDDHGMSEVPSEIVDQVKQKIRDE